MVKSVLWFIFLSFVSHPAWAQREFRPANVQSPQINLGLDFNAKIKRAHYFCPRSEVKDGAFSRLPIFYTPLLSEKRLSKGTIFHIGGGYFLTAYHVIDDNLAAGKAVPIYSPDGRLAAHLVLAKAGYGRGNANDWAVLKLHPSSKWTPQQLANSMPLATDEEIQNSNKVWAIGYPTICAQEFSRNSKMQVQATIVKQGALKTWWRDGLMSLSIPWLDHGFSGSPLVILSHNKLKVAGVLIKTNFLVSELYGSDVGTFIAAPRISENF